MNFQIVIVVIALLSAGIACQGIFNNLLGNVGSLLDTLTAPLTRPLLSFAGRPNNPQLLRRTVTEVSTLPDLETSTQLVTTTDSSVPIVESPGESNDEPMAPNTKK